MRYEIQSINDLSSGAMLRVCFPEEELDRKALYTIQSEWPDFLLPFRYRNVDGMAECTYQLGSQIRLQYRYGDRQPEAYIQFWHRVLKPLLDCSDWFMNPMCFVLEPQHLYTDRDGDMVRYLYVPVKQACVEDNALQKMAAELSRRNPVTDPVLENKVLRAIMEDFQPRAFLQMLEAERKTPLPVRETVPPIPPMVDNPVLQPAPPAEEVVMPRLEPSAAAGQESRGAMDDIVIRFNEKHPEKEKKKGRGLFGGKKKESDKPSAPKGGFFGKKRGKPTKEIVLGAAAEEAARPPEAGQFVPPPARVPPQLEVESEVTQLEGVGGITHLRLVGDPSLPREIPVDIAPGQSFTVGRFDVSVGHRQSSFEFDKGTKAVSRHHAAIERESDGGYVIVDLVSRAGTFLDGQRLMPNVPYPLAAGHRVSFGTGGADYIWEE